MSFDLEAAAASAAAIASSHALAVDKGAFPANTVRTLGESRLLGLISSPDVGGLGLGMPAARTIVERLARECGSSAMVACMHYCAVAVLEKHGPADVRRAIAAGQHFSTLAFSEAGSRSHFWAPLGVAERDGSNVRLDARKGWVTSAGHADSYVWSSKPLAGSAASTLWLVPRTTKGIEVAAGGFDGLGLRGNDSSPVIATGAVIPATAMLGDDGTGFDQMMGIVLPWFNVLTTAVNLGLMESAVEKTIAHVSGAKLQHMGSSIADLPTVRAYVAQMKIKTDMTRTLLDDTIAAISTGRPDTMLRVLECKVASAENATQVTDLAMRVCGGAAFRKQAGIERVFRDARASLVMSPTSDMLYDFIGKAVCGQPLF